MRNALFFFLSWWIAQCEEDAIEAARSADLATAEDLFLQSSSHNARANLAFIRRSEIRMDLFLKAKGQRPPLAALSQTHDCGGFADIFWTSEFSLRRIAREPSTANEMRTAIGVLLADSGATRMALTHFVKANASIFRTALTLPAVYDSIDHLTEERIRLEEGILLLQRGPKLDTLDHNSMPGTFYIVYMGYNDARLMTTLQSAYARAYPNLSANFRPMQYTKKRRIGFVSSYLENERHSVCKLFCGLVRGLSSRGFDVVLYKEPLLSNRDKVDVDVLVFTDIGMETRNLMWAHSRIAPVQILTWGHPHTSGLPDTIDYFVSSDLYHATDNRSESYYAEQLVRFDSLGFYFLRPPPTSREDVIDFGAKNVYLCPQSTPKFHPHFDNVLLRLLEEAPERDAVVVITYDPKKSLWMHTLRRRLHNSTRVVFLPMQADFSRLLRSATILLDPFPFGGGVTTLEAFSLCRIVVTAPLLQTVPGLAAGMYRHAGLEDAPIVASVDEYVDTVHSLVDHPQYLQKLEKRLCQSHDDPRRSIYSSEASVHEWDRFLQKVTR